MPLPNTPISACDCRSLVDPSDEEVRAHLCGVLASPDFAVPARLREFLSFVVEEALAGRGDRLKAYSIAVEVFGRDVNFDVTNDPVVRIEAGRLRRALERYYLLEGKDAPLSITVPKGGYAPVFRRRSDDAPAVAPLPPSVQPSLQMGPLPTDKLPRNWLISAVSAFALGVTVTYLMPAGAPAPGAMAQSTQPVSIVVKPFMILSPAAEAKDFRAGLSEEIVSHLAPISNLTIFRSEALETLPATSSAKIWHNLGSPYVLEGGIRSIDGKIRISSRLLKADTAAIVWSEVYEAKLTGENTIDLETSVGAKIAVAAASSALAKSQVSSASEPVKR